MVLPTNLNRFGGGKRKPYYCEVVYLESTGTQYIDTGLSSSAGFKGKATLIILENTTAILFGTQLIEGSTQPNRSMLFTNSGKIKLGCSSDQYTGPSFSVNTKYAVDFSTESSYYLNVDGTSSVSGTNTDERSTGNIYVFCGTQAGQIGYFSKMRLYYFKMYFGDTLVRDFIPVLDWNMVPCLYDKVSNKLFYNQGTGTFAYGREIHYVEYLESTGTQYIDFGVYGNKNTGIEIEAQATGTPEIGYRLFGCRTSSSEKACFISTNSASDIYMNFYNTSSSSNITCDISKKHNYQMMGKKCYLDGVLVYTMPLPTYDFTTDNTLVLFGAWNGSNFGTKNWKIWKATLYSGYEKIIDLRPAVDENGVGFMFDILNRSVYLNAGTGAFKYPDVEMEYVVANKNGYLDAGKKATNLTKIEAEVMVTTQSTTTNRIFGNYNDTTKSFTINCANLGTNTSRFGSQDVALNQLKLNVNEKHVVGNSQAGITLDGTTLATWSDETFETSGNVALLASTNSATTVPNNIVNGLIGNCYGIKWWENNVLTLDLVPMIHNGTVCMYDKVGETYFNPVVSSSFTAGKIKEAR